MVESTGPIAWRSADRQHHKLGRHFTRLCGLMEEAHADGEILLTQAGHLGFRSVKPRGVSIVVGTRVAVVEVMQEQARPRGATHRRTPRLVDLPLVVFVHLAPVLARLAQQRDVAEVVKGVRVHPRVCAIKDRASPVRHLRLDSGLIPQVGDTEINIATAAKADVAGRRPGKPTHLIRQWRPLPRLRHGS